MTSKTEPKALLDSFVCFEDSLISNKSHSVCVLRDKRAVVVLCLLMKFCCDYKDCFFKTTRSR